MRKEFEVMKASYLEAYQKAGKKAQTANRKAKEAAEEQKAMIAGKKYPEIKEVINSEEFKKISAFEKRERVKVDFYTKVLKTIAEDLMKIAQNELVLFFRENLESFDGVPVRYKKVTQAVKNVLGEDFSFYGRGFMFPAISFNGFPHGTERSFYFTEAPLGSEEHYISGKEICKENALSDSIIGLENIEKTVKKAISDAKKAEKIIRDAKKKYDQLKSQYASNNLYGIFPKFDVRV